MKFMPLYKNKVWGGNKIKTLGFDYDPLPNCGELWALSAVKDNESIIINGYLAENTLNEALEIYMGDLIGEKNYYHFGNEFPLLIKLIDANDRLSIQVHPDDHLAQERGMENGKTEMWYILEADEGAEIVNGFNKTVTANEYQQYLKLGKLESLLHYEKAKTGDVFFIPAGRVHALGKGLMLAEIQQSSDCTYRIYDYNRPDVDGKLRPLHTAEALAAIDFHAVEDGHTHYHYEDNSTLRLAECPYFTTNLIALSKPMRKNFSTLDSFVVYFCVDGIAAVKCLDNIVPFHAGECVLVPAVADMVELFSEGPAKLLEIYIDPSQWKDESRNHQNDFDWIAQFIGGGNPEDYLDDIEYEPDYDDYDGEEEHHHCGCGCEDHHHHHDCDCGSHHHHDGCDCGHHHHHDCHGEESHHDCHCGGHHHE